MEKRSMNIPHPEILLVDKDAERVACDGSGGNKNSATPALGHPKVWYTFHGQDEVVCGYCDRLFTKHDQPGAKPYKDVA